jgi:Family of unknown function (DUF6065)
VKLEAFAVTAASIVTLSPAPARRAWMDRTPQRFANRCLPLMMANQAGWHVSLTEPVEVEWTGDDGLDQVSVHGSDLARGNVASHFGCGIVTFKIPYLFRTPPGFDLLVRGPANLPKDGIAPLEGLVEADWAVAPFTVNWQITRARRSVRFEAGEPVAMIVPQRRGELEGFAPALRDLDDDAELGAAYRAWRRGRDAFIEDLRALDGDAVKAGWQRDYFLGKGPGEREAPEHRTKMALGSFERKPRG